MKTGIIGAGSMGSALAQGLARSERSGQEGIIVFDIDGNRLGRLGKIPGINPAANAPALAKSCEITVIAVKPGSVRAVLEEIREELSPGKLLVSVAAGVKTAVIEKIAGLNVPVVRAMPNTPALINLGITSLSPGRFAEEKHMRAAEEIFSAVGIALRTDEEHMDALTALGGSGPAYLFLLAGMMEKAAVESGLDSETSRLVVRETLCGASAMLKETGKSPEELRENVASPGGVTESALSALEAGGFEGIFLKSFSEAVKKAGLLSKERR